MIYLVLIINGFLNSKLELDANHPMCLFTYRKMTENRSNITDSICLSAQSTVGLI